MQFLLGQADQAGPLARLGRVESTQAEQGTDIAVIKSQLGAPQPTVVTRGAPRH